MSDRIVALDLFAGTGWGVACKSLGIDEIGVELMPEARATREANGMANWLPDVWDVLETADPDSPEFKAALLIASPPCQSFSMAGNGAGRRALDEVLGLIDSGAYLDVAELREFGERHDIRTALVLTPLAYAAKHRPAYVVLEQVPPVLPVWERMAVELRGWGYSVVTGILHAEAFGVPQTRKRAILIARADGVEARMPTPTHSRYYPRDKTRMDPGVLPWVSMAEALGWNDSRIMRSNYGTGGDPSLRGERTGDEPSATVTSKIDRNIIMVSNDKFAHSAIRSIDEPAPTITAGHDSGNRRWVHGEQNSTSTKVTVAEAAALQSYPDGFVFAGSRTKQYLQIGNAVPPLLARAVLATLAQERPQPIGGDRCGR